MNINEIIAKVAGIKTLTGPGQARWLCDLLQTVPQGMVCEIGTYYGYLSAVLAMAGRRVIQIDPHMGGFSDIAPGSQCTYVDVVDNMRRVGVWDQIIPLAMTSIEAIKMLKLINPSLPLVYLDGDHTQECVYMECKEMDRFIPIGGILCGDDCTLKSNVSGPKPGVTFDACWEVKSDEFLYDGSGVAPAVWKFFYGNTFYKPLRNMVHNAFGFRKVA